MDTLSLIGNLASIISLAIAILAWKKADGIEKRFHQNASSLISTNSPTTQTMTITESNAREQNTK
jgi:hypothetical protein